MKNVYYFSEDGLSTIGADSTQSLDNTNIGKSDTKYLQSSGFADAIDEVTDDSVSWKHNPYLNKGYPIIQGNFFINTVKSAGNGITVQGKIHKDLNIKYDLCSENSEEYKLLSSAKDNNKILNTYSVSLTDKNGNYIPAELWCSDSFKISVPVDGENIQLAGINTEGNIVYYKPDSVKNGIAVFTVSHPMSFAVMDTSAEKGIFENSNDSDGSANTGETPINQIIIAVAMLALVVIFGTKRRNKVG